MLTFAVPVLLALLAAPAEPRGQRRDQDQAWAQARQGHLLQLREIERRIVPTMPGAQYLGVEFDPVSAIYTLKFLRDGNVIWVDVDGHSGRIIGREGR